MREETAVILLACSSVTTLCEVVDSWLSDDYDGWLGL